jgi:putative DNA primase/helicase
MLDLNKPPEPWFWVAGDGRGTGVGKTVQLVERLVFEMSRNADYRCVMAAPRHNLSDDIARLFIDRGFDAAVFRGREALDPKREAPDQKMCRDLLRTNEISKALGDVSRQACKAGSAECALFNSCHYQAQQQLTPRVWIIAHQRLFRQRPEFIPQPDFVGIDEAFWNGSLNGIDSIKLVTIEDLEEIRQVNSQSKKLPSSIDYGATADLAAISSRTARLLREEMSGRIRKAVLDNFEADELRETYRLEWRRKIELEIKPGMPLETVTKLCQEVADHNQQVQLLAQFWELLLRTKTGVFDRSPWLDLQQAIKRRKGSNEPKGGVYMAWSDDIHPSWHANTWIMDATMSDKIVRRFYSHMPASFVGEKSSPYTRIRQVSDRRIAKSAFVPTQRASDDEETKEQKTQRNNFERIGRVIEVRAREVWPGKLLIVCQLDLETALINAGKVPANVELHHFKNISGKDGWGNVPGVMTIGRTEPSVQDVERKARALFNADIAEVDPDVTGTTNWPLGQGYIRLRDGTSVAVQCSRHPDPHVEEVRWQICEAELLQAIGRGRGGNRDADNPLQIDILTSVPLPLLADEALSWAEIQPPLARVMWSRGAAPALSYRDMAAAYPDLFSSKRAVETAMQREAAKWSEGRNHTQTPIVYTYLIGVCVGFSLIKYRRARRGPPGVLLYDPERINPETWLVERLGARVVR